MLRAKRAFAKGLCALLLSGATVGIAVSQSSATRTLSASPRTANGTSHPIMLDPEGRWLLIASSASNLVPNDTNGNLTDLFVYDLQTGEIRLLTPGANGPTHVGEIAADGTVIIETQATNLVPDVNDTNNEPDILIGHISRPGWRYLSTTGRVPTGGRMPRVSPSGKYLAWVSRGSLRVLNRDTGEVQVVSENVERVCGTTDTVIAFQYFDDHQFQSLQLYDLENNRFLRSFRGGVANAAVDGNLVAYVRTRVREIIVFDWARDVQIATFPTGDDPPRLLSLRNGRLMYTETHGRSAQIRIRDVYPVDGIAPKPVPVSVDESGRFRRGLITLLPQTSPLHTDSLAAFEMNDLSPPIVAGDANGHPDVFVRYFDEQITRGVTTGQTANLPNEAAGSVELNFDGQVAVFATPASNLVPDDTNGVADIFVRRSDGQITRLLNENRQQLNGRSYDPHISADGKTVVFVTEASNIEGPPGRHRLVRYHLPTNQIQVVVAAEMDITTPRVSADGTRIIFATDARLTRDDRNDFTDVYLYDVVRGSLMRLPRGVTTSAPTYEPDISPDGDWAVFVSEARELGASPDRPLVFLYDLRTHTVVMPVSGDRAASKPSVSRDGQFVAFESVGQVPQIFVWHRGWDEPRLVSVNSFGRSANLASRSPRISEDGQMIAFESDATNLTPHDGTPDTDIFVHDLRTGWTYAVVRTDCLPGNAPSFKPSLSGDGRWVAFQTTATNLSGLPLGSSGYAAIHQIGCVPPGDVNRDGIVDDADLLQLLFAFGTQGETCADVNMDGVVDDADLLIVLFQFGVSCHFGAAGDLRMPPGFYDGLFNNPSPVEIEETNDTIVYRTTAMTPAYVKSLERQVAEIEMMHRGLWPYPVAGRGSDPWIQAYGDPLAMSSEELQALLDYFNDPLRHQSEEGDFAPAAGSSYTFNQSRTVQLGGNDVNISLNGSIYFNATCQSGGSVVAEAKGDATIKFFSLNYRVAEAYGKASATNAQASVHAYFKVAGQTLWSFGPSSQNLSWSYTSQCHYGGSRPNIGPWSRQWSFSQTWWLGPVPVGVTAGMNVQAGACYKLEASLAPVRAEARFRPYVNSSAFASGGVAFSIGCSASAGVGVSLTLLNYALEAYATLNLGTQNNRCCVFLNAGITNQMTALSGRFYIFAEACCWGLSGPKCGWGRREQRWEHDLFRWNGFSSSGHLWGPWSFTYCFK